MVRVSLSPRICLLCFSAVFILSLQGCGNNHLDPSSDEPYEDPVCGPTCSVCEDETKCKMCKAGLVLNKMEGWCGYKCDSELVASSMVNENEYKGICLDDTTFRFCSAKTPITWPNTGSPGTQVKTLRLFKAWQEDWEESNRKNAWDNVAAFVKGNGIKVLLGTSISCSEQADSKDWNWVKDLIKVIGAEHIMGVAIGNEVELIWNDERGKKDGKLDKECMRRLWDDKYFFKTFKDRVQSLNSMGLPQVPVTTVLSGYALGSNGFVEVSGRAKLNTFMTDVISEFSSRFVFSNNVYGYFDSSANFDSGSSGTCSQALNRNLCFSSGCFMGNQITRVREAMNSVGASGNKLWVTETGWSFPVAETLVEGKNYKMDKCDAWSDEDAFRQYYTQFLDWRPTSLQVDHVFYFTIRDSLVNGVPEGFGLIGRVKPEELCDVSSCKLQPQDSTYRLPGRIV